MIKNIFASLGLVGLLSGCATNATSIKPSKPEEKFEELLQSVKPAALEEIAANRYLVSRKSGQTLHNCNAFHLGDGYLLTAAHCLGEEIEVHAPVWKGDEKMDSTFGVGARLIKSRPDYDVALIFEPLLSEYPLTIGLARQLAPGDDVFYMPFTSGGVQDLGIQALCYKYPKNILKNDAKFFALGGRIENEAGNLRISDGNYTVRNTYEAKLPVMNGFSGAAVFSVREGKLYLAGIITGMYSKEQISVLLDDGTSLPLFKLGQTSYISGPENIRELLGK